MRIEDDVWTPFTKATKASSSNNSQITREFMAWFARLPGAKLPKRPPASDPGRQPEGDQARPENQNDRKQ